MKRSDQPRKKTLKEKILQEKEQQIRPYFFDLLGHLYFADPKQKLDLKKIEKLNSEINLIEPWSSFANELITSLSETQTPPYKRPIDSWLSAYSTEIKNLS